METKSNINFENFFVTEFEFKRIKPETKEDIFKLVPRGIINKERKDFFLKIKLVLIDYEEGFAIEMESIGTFQYEDMEQDLLEKYISINSPAIIFPYIRAFISSYTSLSGFETVTLNTMNMLGYSEEILLTLKNIDESKHGEKI